MGTKNLTCPAGLHLHITRDRRGYVHQFLPRYSLICRRGRTFKRPYLLFWPPCSNVREAGGGGFGEFFGRANGPAALAGAGRVFFLRHWVTPLSAWSRLAMRSAIQRSTSDFTKAMRRSPSGTAAGKMPCSRNVLILVRDREVRSQASFKLIRTGASSVMVSTQQKVAVDIHYRRKIRRRYNKAVRKNPELRGPGRVRKPPCPPKLLMNLISSACRAYTSGNLAA